jgi:spoIIIJ-associated protein
MKSVVKMAKTVDEAVKQALIELGTTEEDVEINVIEEPSKGFLGLIGSKDAKVKVTIIYDPIEIADSFLSKMLNSMGIKSVNIIKKDGKKLLIDITDISSTDKGIIIGKRGNTLDAIQYLISLAVNKGKSKYLRVVVDTEGYREKREQTLIKLANRMAEKSKHTNRPVKLEPMNPYERRIIHFALQKVQGITTYSEGEEPYRRVVIQSK